MGGDSFRIIYKEKIYEKFSIHYVLCMLQNIEGYFYYVIHDII